MVNEQRILPSKHIRDIRGQTFGKLTVLEFVAVDQLRRATWVCLCSCGRTRKATTGFLRYGTTTSCGKCKNHGMCDYPEYSSWSSMLTRCYNPKSQRFYAYGARGIKVCQEWRDSFVAFFSDMGPRPGPNYSLERKNNNGDYEKSNCEWIPMKKQARNKRNTLFATIYGIRKSIADWADHFGIVSPKLASNRIFKGWNPYDAVTVAQKTTSVDR